MPLIHVAKWLEAKMKNFYKIYRPHSQTAFVRFFYLVVSVMLLSAHASAQEKPTSGSPSTVETSTIDLSTETSPPEAMEGTGSIRELSPETLIIPSLGQPDGGESGPNFTLSKPLEAPEIILGVSTITSQTPEVNNSPSRVQPPKSTQELGRISRAKTAWDSALVFLKNGGASIWAIAALAVITLALILWKIWRLALIGAWSQGKSVKAVDAFVEGDHFAAQSMVRGRAGIRSKVVSRAIQSSFDLEEESAREETSRVAKKLLGQASVGLGTLELIATIAPLLGLLGTVLGMIAAFQALQESGSNADPSLLAGGIWEALLTTAAGMAVAIPASVGLTWFEAVIGRIRRDLEDSVSRIFVAQAPAKIRLAAE